MARRGWSRSWRSSSRSPTSCWWTPGSGLGPGIVTLAAAADEAVIVTTPEPTSVADAHAAINRFRRARGPPRAAGRSSTRRGRLPRPCDVLDRLVASSRQFLGTVVYRWDRARSGPIPMSPWPSAIRRPFLVVLPWLARFARGPPTWHATCGSEHQPQHVAVAPDSSRRWPPAGH